MIYNNIMKPIIKWVGGKRRFLKLIKEHIAIEEINNYYEPFAGSAALFFDLEHNGSYINDLNFDLINFYSWLKEEPTLLHNAITEMFDDYNFEGRDYYEIRERFNGRTDGRTSLRHAADFFFLNKAGFNGIYRVNLSGKFNVPQGSTREPFIPLLAEFVAASYLLENATLSSTDYLTVIQDAVEGDLVYLDPPYYPDDSSRFTGYTDPKFGTEQHQELANIANVLVNRGVRVIISNSASHEFQEKLGDNFNRIDIPTRRSINPTALNKERFMETLYVSIGGNNG